MGPSPLAIVARLARFSGAAPLSLGDSASQPLRDGAEDRTSAFRKALVRGVTRVSSEAVPDADASYPLIPSVRRQRSAMPKRERAALRDEPGRTLFR
jgi:hypothetical protein